MSTKKNPRQVALESLNEEELLQAAIRWAAKAGCEPNTLENPRLKLLYQKFWENQEPSQPGAKQRHVCSFTKKEFFLPWGAPVPALAYDCYNHEGKEIDDGNDMHFDMHPCVAAYGTDAVGDAVADRIEGLRTRAADLLLELAELMMLLAEIDEKGISVEWPSYWLKSEVVPEGKEGLHNVETGEWQRHLP